MSYQQKQHGPGLRGRALQIAILGKPVFGEGTVGESGSDALDVLCDCGSEFKGEALEFFAISLQQLLGQATDAIFHRAQGLHRDRDFVLLPVLRRHTENYVELPTRWSQDSKIKAPTVSPAIKSECLRNTEQA